MKLADVKKIAKERGLQSRNMKKVDLIRAIQRSEGNADCYNTNSSESCGQRSCLWRDDCR
ncbi:MAG TPA: SAP domain-containing protein [Geobacteraceae bacterium]|nr:SAP domain-containing protein [Geobacteraceae bacterium]